MAIMISLLISIPICSMIDVGWSFSLFKVFVTLVCACGGAHY